MAKAPGSERGPRPRANGALVPCLNVIERMSVADRPVPRVFIFSPSDPEGRRNCADHPDAPASATTLRTANKLTRAKQTNGKASGSNHSRFRAGVPGYTARPDNAVERKTFGTWRFRQSLASSC